MHQPKNNTLLKIRLWKCLHKTFQASVSTPFASRQDRSLAVHFIKSRFWKCLYKTFQASVSTSFASRLDRSLAESAGFQSTSNNSCLPVWFLIFKNYTRCSIFFIRLHQQVQYGIDEKPRIIISSFTVLLKEHGLNPELP